MNRDEREAFYEEREKRADLSNMKAALALQAHGGLTRRQIRDRINAMKQKANGKRRHVIVSR